VTNAQTPNDALAIVAVACTRTLALRCMGPAKTAFIARRRPADCQVLVHLPPTRVRIRRKAPGSAPAARPRSP